MDFLFSFALFELVEETLEAHHREGDLHIIVLLNYFHPFFHPPDLRLDVGGRHSGNERWKDPLACKLNKEPLELLLIVLSVKGDLTEANIPVLRELEV